MDDNSKQQLKEVLEKFADDNSIQQLKEALEKFIDDKSIQQLNEVLEKTKDNSVIVLTLMSLINKICAKDYDKEIEDVEDVEKMTGKILKSFNNSLKG